MDCGCRILLGGVVYSNNCPEHSTLPKPTPCGRCPRSIGPHDGRLMVDGVTVHYSCADERERLGLADGRTPMMRQEDERRQGRDRTNKLPLFMQPGAIARLRRRRR